MINFGEVPAGAVLPIYFDSFAAATGAPITITGLATSDIEVVKGTSVTVRASDAGYALLDTDGIDIGGRTGIHGFTIDTGDNTDGGFYSVGGFFTVFVDAVTIDTQTVRFIAATFRIKAAEAVAGKAKVDVDAWLGTAAATPTVAGVPEVDVTHWRGDVPNNTNAGRLDARVTAIASGTIGSGSFAVGAIDASALAADAVTEIQSGLATAADLATVDTVVDAIKLKTDLIPGTQDGKTFAQHVVLQSSALMGKVSGFSTSSPVYRAIDDSKDRITATTTADGRTAVILDAT